MKVCFIDRLLISELYVFCRIISEVNIKYRDSPKRNPPERSELLALGHSQGRGRASGPNDGAAGALLLVWGPLVLGRCPLGPGPARLGGAEGRSAVEAGPHAEGGARPCHAAAGASARWQAADGAVAQGTAPGARDGGHLQRFHPVGVAVDNRQPITCSSAICLHLFPKLMLFTLWWCVSVAVFL